MWRIALKDGLNFGEQFTTLRIDRFTVQSPLIAWLSFETQSFYEPPGGLWIESEMGSN